MRQRADGREIVVLRPVRARGYRRAPGEGVGANGMEFTLEHARPNGSPRGFAGAYPAVRMDTIVLASRSPQRRAILEQLGYPFRAVVPDYDEPRLDLAPAALVEVHSRAKARSVAPAPGERLVLGVDTAVVVDERVL